MVMDTSQFLVIWTNKKRDVASFSRENSSRQCEVTFLHHMSASCSCLLLGRLHMTLILLSSRRHWRQSTLPETMKADVWRGTRKQTPIIAISLRPCSWCELRRIGLAGDEDGSGETGRRQLINLWSRAAEMLHQLIPRFKAEDLIDEKQFLLRLRNERKRTHGIL